MKSNQKHITQSLRGRASQVHVGKHSSLRGTIWEGAREKRGTPVSFFKEASRRDVMPRNILGLLEDVCCLVKMSIAHPFVNNQWTQGALQHGS